MKLYPLLAGAAALAFATGAIAQDAVPAPADPVPEGAPADSPAAPVPATEGAGMPAAEAVPAPQPDAAVPQTAMTSPAADPVKEQAADQLIAQNWSKYDPDNKGELTPLEFGNLILAAQGNDMTAQAEKSRQSKAPNLASTKVLNATATEFSRADTNADHMVSRDELKAYLLA